jgi:hypothetical protein
MIGVTPIILFALTYVNKVIRPNVGLHSRTNVCFKCHMFINWAWVFTLCSLEQITLCEIGRQP